MGIILWLQSFCNFCDDIRSFLDFLFQGPDQRRLRQDLMDNDGRVPRNTVGYRHSWCDGSEADNHLLVQSSPNLNTHRHDVHKPCSSLPLLLKSHTRSTTNSSISDFLDDPLAVLRYQTLSRIQGNVSREKRLAVVTCLLITVFILCYLPFWSVYTCLVSSTFTSF